VPGEWCKSRKLIKHRTLVLRWCVYSLVKSLPFIKTINIKRHWYMRRSIKAHFCAYPISMRDGV
jgi:hypothetical protein